MDMNTKTNTFDWHKAKKYIMIFVIAGVALMAFMGIYADYNKLGDSVQEFNFLYLPIILILAPLNYCFRFLKWNYYMRRLGIHVDRKINVPVFIAGLSMTITPGKVGEFFKSYLLKELAGVKISRTAPMVLMERLTDGIAMVILASVGAAIFSFGWAAIIACFCIIALFVAVVRIKKLSMFFINLLGKVKFLSKFAHSFEHFYEQTYELMHPVTLLVSILIGVVSWFFEGVVIFFALKAFSVDISVLSSVFTVSVSSLVGAISMLPGGLIAAEGSIMSILVLLFGVDKAIASATTIVTRFSTLWLGVALGLIGMVIVQRKLNKKAAELKAIEVREAEENSADSHEISDDDLIE